MTNKRYIDFYQKFGLSEPLAHRCASLASEYYGNHQAEDHQLLDFYEAVRSDKQRSVLPDLNVHFGPLLQELRMNQRQFDKIRFYLFYELDGQFHWCIREQTYRPYFIFKTTQKVAKKIKRLHKARMQRGTVADRSLRRLSSVL